METKTSRFAIFSAFFLTCAAAADALASACHRSPPRNAGAETFVLLSDALVTLEWWKLAAGVAFEHWVLPASTDDSIAVALRTAPSSRGGRDAVILTAGVLAEVDLDPAVF